jgi:hypothetical protein
LEPLITFPNDPTTQTEKREKVQLSSIQHHRILYLTPMNFLTCSVSMPFGVYDHRPNDPKTKGEKNSNSQKNIQHVAQCKSSIGLQESLNNRTHIHRGIEFLRFEFCLITELRDGWGHKFCTQKMAQAQCLGCVGGETSVGRVSENG